LLFSLCIRIALAVGTNDTLVVTNEWAFELQTPGGNASETTVSLPHTFNPFVSLSGHLEGVGVYRKSIRLPTDWRQKSIALIVEQPCLRVTAVVDGKPVGQSEFSYLPLRVDISEYARLGESMSIELMVDSRLRKNDVPDRNCDGWWLFGGILGRVLFVAEPANRLAHISVSTICVGPNCFDATCSWRVVGQSPSSVVLRVVGTDEELLFDTVAVGGSNMVHARVDGLVPWSPANPYQYTWEIVPRYGRTNGAPVRLKRGFAHFTTQGRKFILNGEPVYLRGLGRQDMGVGGLPTREERLSDLVDIKRLSANFLRTGHYPQPDDVYRLCDSLGLLAIVEVPAWKTSTRFLASDEGRELVSHYAEGLVSAYGNHTCVAAWSIGNEFVTLGLSTAESVRATRAVLAQLDPVRPVTFCTYLYQFDRALGYVDFISINEYFGWHFGDVSMLGPTLAAISRECPDKPILISETGSSALRGLRRATSNLAGPVRSLLSKDFSEDHQAAYLSAHLAEAWQYRQLCSGVVVWCYNDFWERRGTTTVPGLPPGLNAMGIVDTERREKLSYEIVAKHFRTIEDEYGHRDERSPR
jgi:beta-galactosidase/beta-glucuronidase